MKPDLIPSCPFCEKPALAGVHTARTRRGDRVLAVEVQHWQCATGCLNEDGQTPFRFEDPPLLRANDEAARRAWRAHFGEDMPPSIRPGRKPAEPRDVRVQVLLTRSEAAELDRVRGALGRSAFLRARIHKAG